jgi:hypothetical protein
MIWKDLSLQLLDNDVKRFERNKIVYSDFENKILNSEFWTLKNVSLW